MRFEHGEMEALVMADDDILAKIQAGWAQTAARDKARYADERVPEDVHWETEYRYENSADPQQTLNLYYPARRRNATLPTVIDVHGGGWFYGDRNLNRNYCRYLASQGYAVMGMGYRLLPDVDVRGQIQDIFASLRWLSHFGPQRGFDLDHVLLTGDSAGGHLASLVACIQQSEELQELFGVDRVNFNFTLVALVCPVAEPGKLPEAAGDMSDMAAFYLDKLSGGDAALADHLNFSHVAKDLKLPPFMLIGGQNDSFYLQSQVLLEVFAADKVTYTTKLWPASAGPHLKHVFNVQHWEWPESIETNLAMLRQFDVLSKQRDEAEADDEDDL